MSFSLFSNNGKISYGLKNYIADTVDDLKNIPKDKPGNMVFVIEESKYYILNNNNTWTEKVDGAPEPEGTISITANGTTNVAGYAEANVNVQPTLQNKTVTPTETSQTVTADNNYNGLGEVTVNAIPQEYIVPEGSLSITENGAYDVTQYAEAEIEVSGSSNISGWLLDIPNENGVPTRARFFPSESNTNSGEYVFKRETYDKNVVTALTDVEYLPGTVTIGTSSLHGCSSVERITIADTVAHIKNMAFQGIAIHQLVLPIGLSSVGDYFCRYCENLEYIDFGGVHIIGYYLFTGSALKTCICHANITTIQLAQFPNTMELYDFSANTQVPNLMNVTTIGYGAGTVIRVPSALLSDWQAATNWCDLPTDPTAERYVVWEGV